MSPLADKKESADKEPTVVMLHGLGRTHRSMTRLRRHVESLGYRTWACTYPSRRMNLHSLAAQVVEWIDRDLGASEPLLAITHSMGGILIRHMHTLPWCGVVMLAPPNRGSTVAATLGQSRIYRAVYGPAATELGDSGDWPPPPHPFAVIAGTRGPSVGNPPSWLIRSLGLIPAGQAHDGTVLVEETQFEGMVGFAEVEASHTFLMDHPQTRRLITRFLSKRRF